MLEKGLQRGFIVPFLGLFFNQVLMTSLIFKELKIPELELYPEECRLSVHFVSRFVSDIQTGELMLI